MSLKGMLTSLFLKVTIIVIAIPVSLVMLFKRIKHGSDYFKIRPRTDPPAILSDTRFGSHHYVHLAKQSIRLHYVEKGDKNNPLLLCLHGFPDCWYSWRTVLEKFSDKYWVVAVDMRGYGGSDKPEGINSYSIEHLVEDIRELIKVLGKEKCTLVAHDWGGVIGWFITSKYPELFHKHISLNGPHFKAMMEHRYSSWSQFKKSWYILFFQCWYLPELMMCANNFEILDVMFRKPVNPSNSSYTEDEVELYKYYFSQKYALTAPINYYRHAMKGKKEDVPICKVDSLIIWGAEDTALDKEIAEKTYKYCEKLQVDYIENCGHFVLQECPEAVHKAMWQFLDH